ncbi:hypothetical protein PC111_g9061 [Phytophthora cactorum]|nr:hypothetical protein PC111_g9061 [Phytophthora cactorum]
MEDRDSPVADVRSLSTAVAAIKREYFSSIYRSVQLMHAVQKLFGKRHSPILPFQIQWRLASHRWRATATRNITVMM